MKRNIVHYVTKQYMQQNRKRTWITFFGIVFMVLLMTCVFVGKDTAIGYLQDVASQRDGKWHIALYDITKEQRDEVLALQGVKETARSTDYGVTEFAQSGNAERPYLNVKAYQGQCFDWINIKVKEGRLPEQSDEIVISEAALTDGAVIGIGDTITAEYFTRSLKGIDPELESTYFPFQNLTVKYGEMVEVPQNFPYYGANDSFEEIRDYTGQQQEYHIVGIIETPGFEEQSSAGYTAITALQDAEEADLENFNLSVRLDLKSAEIDDMDYIMQFYNIADDRVEFNDYVLVFSANSSERTLNYLVFFLCFFFVTLIMFVSVILIYNVFNISFEERSWYLGMLSSVGATGKQKRSSIYYEAFYLLLFALPLGILAGLVVVKLGMMAVRSFLDQFLSIGMFVGNIDVVLHVSGKALVTIVILSVFTVLLSAFLPARKVGKIGPIECIRGNTDKKNRQYRMSRKLLKSGNAEKMLADNAIKRQAKKTRAVIAAAVSFMVILGVTAFGANAVSKAAEMKIAHGSDIELNDGRWDYIFTMFSMLTPEYEAMKQEIIKAKGVAEVTEWYENMFVGTVPMDCLSEEYWNAFEEIYRLYGEDGEKFLETWSESDRNVDICILGFDSEILEEIALLTGSDIEKLNNEETPGAIVVQSGELSTDKEGFADRKPEQSRYYEIEHMTDKKVGEEMPISIYSPTIEEVVEFPVQVAGYATSEQLEDYVSVHSQFLWLIVSNDTASKMGGLMEDEDDSHLQPLLQGLLIRLSDDEDGSEIAGKLSRLNEESGIYFFSSLSTDKNLSDAIIGTVNVLAVCFVILTSIICLFNLFNSIQGRINERSREFAMLESVGMTKDQLGKMLLYECMAIVLKSIIYAAVIAGILCYLIQYGVIMIFGPMQISFPWLLMTGAVVLTVLVVAGLTKYCYRKRKPETILERIRRESV